MLPSPGFGRPPPPPSTPPPPAQDKAKAAGPELQPPPLSPSSPAGVHGPRREVRGASGEWALPGARQRGPPQGGQSRETVTPRAAGRSAAGNSPGVEAGTAASPAANADKAPDSTPPPPASRPVTQRHAHSPHPLRISLVGPAAARLRPPPTAAPPLPRREGTACENPLLARVTVRGELAGPEQVVTPATAAWVSAPAIQSAADTGRGQLLASP